MSLILITISSCTNEFEKARTSNDPKLILSKANSYFKEKDYVSAQTLYELSIQYYRGKEEAEDIFLNLAYTFYHTGEYITANHYFNNFVSTFYNSKKKEEADYMAAFAHYKMSPNYKLDQTFSLKSIESLQNFITKYPESSKLKECNKLIDEMRAKLEKKAFHQGLLYYNLSEYQSAVRSLELLLKDYPGSSFEEQAKHLLVKSSYELADKSIEDKKAERFNETLTYCKKYAEKFKDKKYQKEVKEIQNNTILKLKNL